MPMTEYEICREYLLAKNPAEQIGILADENCMTRGEIREILYRNSLTDKRIKIKPPRKKTRFYWDAESDGMLVKLHERGFRTKQIAEYMGLEYEQVQNRLTKIRKAMK